MDIRLFHHKWRLIMFDRQRGLRWKWALGAALIASLLITGVVLAYYIDIDTNNGAWDTDWLGHSANVTDVQGDAPAGNDIRAVWVSRTDPMASEQYLNFLIEVDSHSSPLEVYVLLDCSGEDRWVVYDSSFDLVVIADSAMSPLYADDTLGEDVTWTTGFTHYGTEFKAPFTYLGSCASDTDIVIHVGHPSSPDDDEVQQFSLNVPTAIELVSLEGRPAAGPFWILIAAAATLFLGLSLAWRRRRT
jgi:hypothetical protein